MTEPTTDTEQTARRARREPLLVLLSRMQRGVLPAADRDLLRAAVETELVDGDQAREQLAAANDITWPSDEDEEPTDSDSDVLSLISEIAGRLTDATDEGEYQAAGLIGDLANGRKTIADAREELAEITFRHV